MPGQCTYCGTQMNRKQSARGQSIDHIIPRAKLRHSKVILTDKQRAMNKVSCCIGCNNRKADMDPREWLSHIHDPKRRLAVENLLELLPVNLIYEASHV